MPQKLDIGKRDTNSFKEGLAFFIMITIICLMTPVILLPPECSTIAMTD